MSLSAEEKEIRITAIDSILKTKGAAFEEISNQASYIKEVGERYHITPIFINYIVYKRLAQNPSREWQYFTLLMAVIIFISSDIFAYEHKKHMIDLIRCTKKGKLRLVLSKVMTLSLTTLISYTLIYLPYYINFIKTFGTESLNTASPIPEPPQLSLPSVKKMQVRQSLHCSPTQVSVTSRQAYLTANK